MGYLKNLADFIDSAKEQFKKVENGSLTYTVIIRNGVPVSLQETITKEKPLDKGAEV